MKSFQHYAHFCWGVKDFSFKEIKYAYLIWMICFIPVITLTIVLEFCINVDELMLPSSSVGLTGNAGSVISYLSVYVLHIIVCIVFILGTIFKEYEEISHIKQQSIKRHFILLVIATSLLLTFFSCSGLVISKLSHWIVYDYFINITEISTGFKLYTGLYNAISFYPFSIIPLSATVLGVSTVIASCFEMSACTCYLEKTNSCEEWSTRFPISITQARHIFIKLVIVLSTSSAATSLYFLLPYEGEGNSPELYFYFAKAMSLKWGMLFSVTIAFVYLVPFLKYVYKIRELKREIELYSNIQHEQYLVATTGYKILSENAGYVLSTILPLLISIISPMFS